MRPPTSTLFPYTTLFRSGPRRGAQKAIRGRVGVARALHDVWPGLAGEALEIGNRQRRRCVHTPANRDRPRRSEEHTSELQSLRHLVCRLLLEKKKTQINT